MIGPRVTLAAEQLQAAASPQAASRPPSATSFRDFARRQPRLLIGGGLVLLLLLIAIFALWIFVAAVIYHFTLGPKPPAGIASFISDVFTTGKGWAMIGIGVSVGFLFACVVLAISVVSFPLLLDRNAGIGAAVGGGLGAVAGAASTPAPPRAYYHHRHYHYAHHRYYRYD